MGKVDKNQAKLQFDQRKSSGPTSDGVKPTLTGRAGVPTGEEQDLRQILVAMQHSCTQIDGKIDSLSYRMDRMTNAWTSMRSGLTSRRGGYPRGVTIAKHAGVLRSIRGRLCSLERELEQLEQEHMHGADSRTLDHIHAKLIAIQDTAVAEIQHLGKYATTRAYWEGERPGSVLSNVICPN
ncbi:hypothetical protein NDU88_005498 [Pleurodeles waltl]|uniref:Uncharacterized protein n=1 Tax=Pleurodeles waltl TaxID=8319 RepID=A0AAV7MD37_PLEWA|nr:hypothetical protein NDU88_005498 [Pleurodeles waltl]